MSVKFTAGQLIKMGKFKEAICLFYDEIDRARADGVTNPDEYLGLCEEFSRILLNPSDFDDVQRLGDKMLQMATRIPGYVEKISKEEFYKNVKLNYEIIDTND